MINYTEKIAELIAPQVEGLELEKSSRKRRTLSNTESPTASSHNSANTLHPVWKH